MSDQLELAAGTLWPRWVPEQICLYLAHTELGTPIRALARGAGCHASTVLRQVRRVETWRDDPLIDAGLRRLGALGGLPEIEKRTRGDAAMEVESLKAGGVDEATLTREAGRVLRRLCEPGAVLAVAPGMEKAVVVRDTPAGASTRTAVVDTPVAQALALKGWITCDEPKAKVSRYRVTSAGRTALNRLVAERENQVRGFAEAQAGFENGRAADEALSAFEAAPRNRKSRFALADSPLAALARRRDKDGKPFLPERLVSAGERLREDFELAQMDPSGTQNWEHLMSGKIDGCGTSGAGGTIDAKARLRAALADLGPGLGDVALQCCCYLEGLETTEKRLGWSARSGKVVLRIALQRLRRHYDELGARGGDLIG
ncbi:DUF6456 domain-containing protein [Allosediminivita pacifica]|uniref:DUF6456 domain-containing protein n=1 Tax=Allosediminivita pacifica TaxID=1267769 RepID=A0A2T6B2P2_9RHOB|nr:DUF6456 domain-containing protein [Allosediminivita pacifica]PTX50293.1 hypothetical protein C8N44_105153 [Allosediminivita pacifica]